MRAESVREGRGLLLGTVQEGVSKAGMSDLNSEG